MKYLIVGLTCWAGAILALTSVALYGMEHPDDPSQIFMWGMVAMAFGSSLLGNVEFALWARCRAERRNANQRGTLVAECDEWASVFFGVDIKQLRAEKQRAEQEEQHD